MLTFAPPPGSCHHGTKNSNQSAHSYPAQTIGVPFSMEHQINAVVKAMYFEIRNISRIKSILSYDSVKTLATSLVLSRLDYCNSLLTGITEKKISKLQKAQNCAA